MPKLSKKSLLLFAVILSAVFAGMLYRYLNAPVAAETVIVAQTNISPKTNITADMVKEVSVPKEYIQPNAMQNKKQVIGSVTRESIVAGEQITTRRLVVAGKSAGFTGIIPRDKRAMTVAVNEETGVAGFTKPGDYVDVIVTFDQQELGEPISQTILQNLQVLAYNREAEVSDGATPVADKGKDATNSKTNTVTLAVNPMEAVQLALGDEKGKIRLALRPFMPLDGGVVTTSVTPRSLIDKQLSTTPAYSSKAVQVDYSSYEAPASSIAPAASNSIQMIRGTKSETISIN